MVEIVLFCGHEIRLWWYWLLQIHIQ